jgi:hypothetical protein
MRVHVLYENESWLPPLRRALEAHGLPHEEIFIAEGAIDLRVAPPPGVFVNRMSPSAHTRGHGGGVHFVREYLWYLEQHGRRVINGSAAFALEVSKARQDAALRASGILTPHTVAVVGAKALREAGLRFPTPFITKHNMGGKGLGVKLFRDHGAFLAYVTGPDFEQPFDGVTLLQQYVEPPVARITRVEIVDGKLLYAIHASTAEGFELCPAVECQEGAAGDVSCPVAGTGKFSLAEDMHGDPLVEQYIAFCRAHHVDVAGIEFVEGRDGRRYTYDVNANTNYNADVEAAHGLDGMAAVADLCARELERGRQ